MLLHDVALPRLASSADAGAVALLAETLTAFRLLPVHGDVAIRFNGEVTDGAGAGNLQVLLAATDVEGPRMRLVDIAFSAGVPIGDPLLEPLPPGSGTTVRVSTMTAVLDTSGYARIRASVDERLGDRARTDIVRIYESGPP